jgi:hypothetical protein
MINAKMIVYARLEGAITNPNRLVKNVISRASACVAQLQINGNGKPEADAYHEYPEARILHSAFGRLRLL